MVSEGPGTETLPREASALFRDQLAGHRALEVEIFLRGVLDVGQGHRFQALGALFHIGDAAARDQCPAIGPRLV